MAKIKICGLRFDEDIDYANELLPEYVGFVFWNRSKRYITPEEAGRLRARLDPKIKTVGVFVDEDIAVVEDLLKRGIIKIAQLHGDEGEAYIQRIKADMQCRIMKAFKVKSADDIIAANNSHADMVLLDSGMGTGETFDWSLIKSVNRPYFLAGGLTPENVGKAIEELDPFAVDASSSLETDGRKDRQKIKAFIDEVRKERNHE